MAISVQSYLPEHEPLVKALNRRLAEAGSRWGFYDHATPHWAPPGKSADVRRDYYVALDEAGEARAGYCLKPETFLLNGKAVELASIQGPVSEGVVNPAYGMLAFQLIRDMEDRCANLFGWGASDRVLQLLLRLKWRQFRMPFQLRIVRPVRFLRRNAFLRGSARNRIALDLLAGAGLGSIGIRAAQTVRSWGGRSERHVDLRVEEARPFGAWADEIWEAARSQYGLIAVRDAAKLNVVLPERGWPEATILKLSVGEIPVGWAAVRDTAFQNDARFGSLRVGTVVDALSKPGYEGDVILAARRWLERRRVDLVVSTFTHPVWQLAFQSAGFLSSPNRRPLLFSPGATELIGGDTVVTDGTHLTPLDGDGPHSL